MAESISNALCLSAFFVQESLGNLIEYGPSLPRHTRFPSLGPSREGAASTEPEHEEGSPATPGLSHQEK